MKKNKLVRLFVFLPLLALTSCGFGLNELVFGDAYNSIYWNENYYRVWDDKIDVHGDNKITEVVSRNISRDDDLLFYSYTDNAFRICEPHSDEYSYSLNSKSDPHSYGAKHNMSSIDELFKYNVTSKLFDGRLFCGGEFEKARVQIAPVNNIGDEPNLKDGFGRLFKKELRTADYFAINFKCSVDYKTDKSLVLPAHKCSIKLKLSFFLKNETGYTQSIANITLNKVDSTHDYRAPCNTGDADRESDYMFIGFKLKSSESDSYLDITRCVGFSFQYELIEDEYVSAHNLGHAILLYEVLFPHSTWY